ncbi:MAG: hypothetical protein B6244_10990 [Candidatus Cloacimonetes bacterium 4572_55]|nr:MAG: hypothetical protein B6244_10990 [Candidatus Cloacimonetes bacterium 4572_55]
MMELLTNVEFILLQIITEIENISGYNIAHIVNIRGYREWADLSKTSIYNGLRKLEKKRLVSAYLDTEKRGKGPVPRKYSVTKEGKTLVLKKMVEYLSTTRERNKRFDLALSSVQLLEKSIVLQALSKRESFLIAEEKKVRADYNRCRPCLSLGAESLYRHILSSITNEILFTKELIDFIKEYSKSI